MQYGMNVGENGPGLWPILDCASLDDRAVNNVFVDEPCGLNVAKEVKRCERTSEEEG
jgi:hypothetical protein